MSVYINIHMVVANHEHHGSYLLGGPRLFPNGAISRVAVCMTTLRSLGGLLLSD